MSRFNVRMFGFVAFLLISAQVMGQDTSLSFGGDACGSRIRGDAGATVTSSIDCVLTTENNPGDTGAQGWSISVAGDGLLITDITVEGTAGAQGNAGGFVKSETTDRSGVPGGGADNDCEGHLGAVSAVVLSFVAPVTLDANGSATIAIITTEGTVPGAGEESTGSVSYADGCRGVGQPVRNAVTLNAQTVIPSLGSCSITLAGAQGEICDNGVDDDEDGAADCDDTDCADAANCNPEGDCADGVDNDGDGDVDCADSDCAANPACLGDVVFSFSGDDAAQTAFSNADFSQSVDCVLSNANNDGNGPQGWSFGVTGNGLDIDGISTDGTAAAGASDAGFDLSELTADGGAIQVTILSFDPMVTLDANGSATVASVSVSSTFPAGVTETKSLSYTSGLVGSGLAVENIVAMNDADIEPTTSGYEISLTGIDNNYATMDFDSDGKAVISDIQGLLNYLYLGGGAPDCSAAMDFNGNGRLNVADAVSGLNWLFSHTGTTPAAGAGCQVYDGCDIAAACQ